MKNITYFTFIILITFFFSCKREFSDIVEETEKGVFQIYSYDEYGTPLNTGTGFFIDKNGLAITNHHVVDSVDIAFIKDYKGNIYQIKEIKKVCFECDMVTIQIDNNSETFHPLEITNEIPKKGSDIFVIGNPNGLESTVSEGIVSSIRIDKKDNQRIQISAPISTGSSGSPIFNKTGKVFGVATYIYKEGQNLNFGFSTNCLEKLTDAKQLVAGLNPDDRTYLINQFGKNDKSTILNSIEFEAGKTVVNMSYTNISIKWSPGTLWCPIGEDQNSIYLQNKQTGEKFYAYDATIGHGRKTATTVKLGETIRFKIFFPTVSQISSFDLIHESYENWSFYNLGLQSIAPKIDDDRYYNDFYLQTALTYMKNKDYLSAFQLLEGLNNINEIDNAYYIHLQGIVAFLNTDTILAKNKIQESIEKDGTKGSYFFNLFHINDITENREEALKNISSAIALNPDQVDYRYERLIMHMYFKHWDNAIKDADFCINNGSPFYMNHIWKGTCLFWLGQDPCDDYNKALRLAQGDAFNFVYNKYYYPNCK